MLLTYKSCKPDPTNSSADRFQYHTQEGRKQYALGLVDGLACETTSGYNYTQTSQSQESSLGLGTRLEEVQQGNLYFEIAFENCKNKI